MTLLSKKQRKWLEHIDLASKASSGMYRGERCDFVPFKAASVLEKHGFVSLEIPHNPVHKERWVITDEGRAALSEIDESRSSLGEVK
jgi:hypothetical protein